MVKELANGQWRVYSETRDPLDGKRKNLGTFATQAEAKQHDRALQHFIKYGE